LPVNLAELFVGGRPGKRRFFESLHPEAETGAVPVQDFYQLAGLSAEHEIGAR